MQINKIIFLGTPDFALPTLEKLHQEFGHQLQAVLTKPDSIQGRGHKLVATPAKKFAQIKNIPVFTPKNKKQASQIIQKLNPDLIVVIAYGLILEKEITDRYFCLNIHSSLLPKFRGPSPINAVFLHKESETGLTIIKINEKMDEGDILTQKKIKITPEDNVGTLHDKLSLLGAELTLSYIKNNLLKDKITFLKQNPAQATYCQKITASHLKLDLKMPPKDFVAYVKAFSPSPGAYLIHKEKRIKILKAIVNNEKLEILEVKPEGKKKMSYQDYCKGHFPLI
jgi:methionyl-tRNA formyltransferase